MVSDEEFYDSLIHKNLYSKKKVCKFLLTSIENELSNETINTELLSIEHILPQKKNAVVWQKEVGESYADVYDTYLHTLGNLTITGYNSELGTKSFSEKKKMIEELSKAKILNEMILSSEKWNGESILKRAKKLAKYALNIFKIDKVETLNVTKHTDNANIYNLDDQNIVSGTTPVSYTFYGENINVKSYVAMLVSVANLLYDLEPSVFENLAKEKYKLTTSGRVYVTTEETELRKGKEIGNTGLYFETNLSASVILQFIKSLIKKHDMDPDEFEFVCE